MNSTYKVSCLYMYPYVTRALSRKFNQANNDLWIAILKVWLSKTLKISVRFRHRFYNKMANKSLKCSKGHKVFRVRYSLNYTTKTIDDYRYCPECHKFFKVALE